MSYTDTLCSSREDDVTMQTQHSVADIITTSWIRQADCINTFPMGVHTDIKGLKLIHKKVRGEQ